MIVGMVASHTAPDATGRQWLVSMGHPAAMGNWFSSLCVGLEQRWQHLRKKIGS